MTGPGWQRRWDEDHHGGRSGPLPTRKHREAPESRAFWRQALYFTSLGWLLALPIAAGLLLGWAIDSRLGDGHAWTLTLLGAGIAVAVIELVLVIQKALSESDSNTDEHGADS